MNLRSLFGAIGMAAMVASTAAAAGAQAAPPYYPNVPPPGYRQASATNVAMMSQRVAHMIDHLQRDARDYGGHRVAAVRDLQNAQAELSAAAQFAAEHGYNIQVPPPIRRNPVGIRRPPPTSDTQMMRAQQALTHMIARLQRDSHDFGGHREAAIDLMQHANAELIAAIQFAQAHAYAP